MEQPRSVNVAVQPVTSPWRDEPGMLEVRSGLGVAGLNGFLYAAGGNRGDGRMKSAERLDCAPGGERRWQALPDMKQARSNFALVALGGKVYAVGGFDGVQRLQSVEVYDPLSHRWKACAPMQAPREGLGCVAVEGLGAEPCLVAVGGFDGTRVLRSAERYDPGLDRWTMLPSMLQRPRSFLGAVCLEGLVFAIGGQDDTGAMLDSVEVYGTSSQLSDAAIPAATLSGSVRGGSSGSVEAAVWAEYEAMRLPAPMCNFSACVV